MSLFLIYVFVLDSGRSEIRSFRRVGTGLLALPPLRLPVGSRDFCRMEERWYVLLPDRLYPIQVLDDKGRQVDSIRLPEAFKPAPTAKFDDIINRRPWQSGHLICYSPRSQIIFVPRYQAQIAGFSTDGVLQWTRGLSSHNTPLWEVSQSSQGRTVVSMVSSEVVHEIVQVALLGESNVGVTVRHQSAIGAVGQTSNELYFRVLSLADEQEKPGRRTTVTVAAARDSVLYGYMGVGVPRIISWVRDSH